MKISPYIIYLEMQPNALLLRQNFIIHKKWVLHPWGAINHQLAGIQEQLRDSLRAVWNDEAREERIWRFEARFDVHEQVCDSIHPVIPLCSR
jgi:hypothetical protein